MKNTLQTSDKERLSPPHTGGEIQSWFSALKHSWRAALQIDRSQMTAVAAIRSTIGFALPLALGVATGHVIEGVSLAGGAATLGAVGLTYTYRAKTRTLLLACAGIAFSAFVGSITSRIDWLAILVAGIWGIGAGMLVCLGQPTTIIGLQAVIALIILTHFGLDPAQAAIQAALMFAGALFQTLLAIVPIPWRQTAAERDALVPVYQKLADYAAHTADEQSGEQVRDALLKAYSLLSEGSIQSQHEEMFFGLLDEAERIRLNILVLRRLRQHLKEEDPTARTNSIEYLDSMLQATANQLHEIANELKLTPQLSSRTNPSQQIKQALTALRQQSTAPHYEETIQPILAYGEALRDQLHIAKKLAKSWKYRQQHLSIHLDIPKPTRLRVYDTWAILRANLTLRSSTFRHALRLGVALALATALYRIVPLPLQRGYWIPLTVLLVLKPDFRTTFARGVARTLGTMLGAVLTTLVLSLLAPTPGLLVILDTIMAYLAFSVLFVNYALFSAFLTMETVFLLTFVTPQPLITAEYRAIDTAVGGILALLIYILWPTWESSQVPRNLADRLEALRHYCVAVMEAYANPRAYDAPTLLNLRMELRLARSNAQGSVERALHEPKPDRIDPDLAQGVLRATDNIAQCALALEAYLIDNPTRHALPEMSTFAKKVDEALHLLATAIREEQSVSTLPDLQKALQALKYSRKSAPDTENEADLQFVLTEAKRIIRNINTIYQILSTKRRQGEPVSRTGF